MTDNYPGPGKALSRESLKVIRCCFVASFGGEEIHCATSEMQTAPNGKYCSYHRRIAYLLRMARRSKGNVRRQKGVPKWKGL